MTAADRASEHATGPLGAPSAPGPGLRWCRVFPGEDRQLGLVRHWLASLLPECPARDDVASVATELGSNAVRHTASGRGGCFAVEIAWHQSVVRVSVTDGGSSSVPQLVDDPSGEHGRGLLVVQALSTRSGVCGDRCSRLIWADVPWDGAVDANPASAQNHGAASICEPPAIGRSGGQVADATAAASALRDLTDSPPSYLPKRLRSLLPPASAGRRAHSAAGPEMLCRVLDGLNRL
jgi:hypothetical protein